MNLGEDAYGRIDAAARIVRAANAEEETVDRDVASRMVNAAFQCMNEFLVLRWLLEQFKPEMRRLLRQFHRTRADPSSGNFLLLETRIEQLQSKVWNSY